MRFQTPTVVQGLLLEPPRKRSKWLTLNASELMLLALRTMGPESGGAGDPGAEEPGGAARWDRSWSRHAEIHQATGMVLVQLDISATDALARLRAHAFVHQRLLIDVARDVVDRRLVFTEGMT